MIYFGKLWRRTILHSVTYNCTHIFSLRLHVQHSFRLCACMCNCELHALYKVRWLALRKAYHISQCELAVVQDTETLLSRYIRGSVVMTRARVCVCVCERSIHIYVCLCVCTELLCRAAESWYRSRHCTYLCCCSAAKSHHLSLIQLPPASYLQAVVERFIYLTCRASLSSHGRPSHCKHDTIRKVPTVFSLSVPVAQMGAKLVINMQVLGQIKKVCNLNKLCNLCSNPNNGTKMYCISVLYL